MAKLLKLRRGTTTQHGSFTGAEGEVTIDTTKDTAVVHDGSTQGGTPLAKEDMANVSSASIAGRLGTDSIATTKIAGGALPTDVTVTNANVVSNAAIAGTKISPDFGSQNITTTGTITTTGILDTGVATVNGVRCTIVTDGSTDNGCFLNAGDTGAGNRPDIVLKGAGSAGLGQKAFEIFYNNGSNLVFDINYQGDVSARHADFSAGIDVTGNITATGTVDGKDISALGITGTTLDNGVTATTQAASDNTTKVATTAYVTTAIGNADAFPSGTKMLFQQTSAPTGWTKVTSGVDNKALRVVSGTAGSGGSNAFSNTLADRSITANAGNTTATGNISVADASPSGNVSVTIANATTGGTVSNHTLSLNEIPSHYHGITGGNYGQNTTRADLGYYRANTSLNTNSSGGSGAHSHGFTGGSHSHNANASFTGAAHSHNATFTGAAHNHSISVTNLDLAVSYLDVIIASKD